MSARGRSGHIQFPAISQVLENAQQMFTGDHKLTKEFELYIYHCSVSPLRLTIVLPAFTDVFSLWQSTQQ
jgi:hypothetical protein